MRTYVTYHVIRAAVYIEWCATVSFSSLPSFEMHFDRNEAAAVIVSILLC